MTLIKIEEARRALEELKTDEAELSRLHTDQLAGIQALKDGGSKDFALLATLEAKRTALATLLADQRSRVASAAGQLTALEVEGIREAKLARAAQLAQLMWTARRNLDQGLLAFAARAAAEVLPLIEEQSTWSALRKEWESLADALGAPATDAGAERHEQLLASLKVSGVDVTTLQATRYPRPGALFEQFDPWPFPPAIERGHSFELRLNVILQDAVLKAIEARWQVDEELHRIPGVGGFGTDTGLLSHLLEVKEAVWSDPLNPQGVR